LNFWFFWFKPKEQRKKIDKIGNNESSGRPVASLREFGNKAKVSSSLQTRSNLQLAVDFFLPQRKKRQQEKEVLACQSIFFFAALRLFREPFFVAT
jgi:hypothetical protein